MPRLSLKALALITLIAFPIIGFGIWTLAIDENFFSIFENKRSVFLQLITGLFIGLIAALLAIQIIRTPAIENSTKRYTRIMKRLSLNLPIIILVSISAGVGEEILFRGVLQKLIGLWPAAILFVAIHGYLNPMDWRISIYGVYLVLLAAAFGYLYENQGIWSPILAHAAFDFVILMFIKKDLLYPEHITHSDEEE